MDSEKGEESPGSVDNMVAEESTNESQDQEYLTGLKLYMTMFSVTTVGFLISLDSSIVVTAIPRITAHFNSIADIGWYGSAYLIANSVCQLNSGKIYQHHSIKITFLVFFSIFEIGSLVCGIAQSSLMLIMGRMIAGIGGSGLMNGGFVLLATIAPVGKRPFYLGVIMAFILLGLTAGPFIGGVITERASWRWCFYTNLPIGAISAIIVVFTKWPADKPKEEKLPLWELFKRLDLVGFLTFAPFCVMLLLALQWGGTNYPWGSATIIGLFCGSFAAFCVFLGWEHRIGDRAMMPLSLLRRRIVYSTLIVSVLQMGGIQVFAYYLPVWFQVIKAASPAMSGAYFMGTVGPQIILSVVSGALISKVGYYISFSIGGNAISAVASGLLSTLTIHSKAGKFIGYQIICGVGRGVIMQQPITAIQAAVPTSQISIGTALVVFTQFFGGGVFIALGQTIFTNSLGPALEKFAPSVDAKFVINVGATSLRHAVPASELNGVLMAYNEALVHTFYLSAGAAVGAFIVSWGMGWVNVKKAKQTDFQNEKS